MSLDWILLALRILAALILYTFLGVAFYLIWRDLNRSRELPQTLAQLRVVTTAQDSLLAAGDALPLYPITLLGRDPDNTIVLHDASASGHHARISREQGVWWLEDLASRNGTTLNDLPVSKPSPLTNNDVIGIGNLRFRLETV